MLYPNELRAHRSDSSLPWRSTITTACHPMSGACRRSEHVSVIEEGTLKPSRIQSHPLGCSYENGISLLTESIAAMPGDQLWSGQRDSNPRPPAPKAGALPDCAMPRIFQVPLPNLRFWSQADSRLARPGLAKNPGMRLPAASVRRGEASLRLLPAYPKAGAPPDCAMNARRVPAARWDDKHRHKRGQCAD
jgi:hypothetical protein